MVCRSEPPSAVILYMKCILSFCDTCTFVNSGWLIRGTLHKRSVGVWIAQCRPTEINCSYWFLHPFYMYLKGFVINFLNECKKQDDFLCPPTRTFLLYVCLFCLGTDGIYIILRLFHRGMYRLYLLYKLDWKVSHYIQIWYDKWL